MMKALEWLVEVQNRDGGWLCPYMKAHIKDKHGCFYGTIGALDAFSEVPKTSMYSEMKSVIEKGAEFLLMHRLFKADHHEFQIIKKHWLNLGFPNFGYDILRGLSIVTKLGYVKDERLKDAFEILISKQGDDGRWVLEDSRVGNRMSVKLEQKGMQSKWITLNALRVIRRINL